MSIIKSVTCPVCGCLCDDIELTIADGAVAQVKNGCAMCEAKFFSHNNEHRLTTPLYERMENLFQYLMMKLFKNQLRF